MATADSTRPLDPQLNDRELAEIRAIAAKRVAGFPPLSREQAALVRAALTGRTRQEPAGELA